MLPRDIAAGIISRALSPALWSANAFTLLVAVPVLLEYLNRNGALHAAPPVVGILLALAIVAVVGAFRPHRAIVAAYLLLAIVGGALYQSLLFEAVPDIGQDAVLLLNRPAMAAVLVGVASSARRDNVVLALAGLVTGLGTTAIAAQLAGQDIRLGWGPVMVFLLSIITQGALALIQASQRRRLPDFDALEQETRRQQLDEELRGRITSKVHDTLLNDLSILMTTPDPLSDRVRERLRTDLATLTSPDWLRQSEDIAVLDEQDAALRNQLTELVHDMQWRGLSVNVTGSGAGVYRLDPDVATAVVDGVRAALENCVRHSGADSAEIDLGYTAEHITVTVSDAGRGFDPSTVPSDRLGLRYSVERRIASVGGSARIWSTPGDGTSVVLRVPIAQVVTPHGEGA